MDSSEQANNDKGLMKAALNGIQERIKIEDCL